MESENIEHIEQTENIYHPNQVIKLSLIRKLKYVTFGITASFFYILFIYKVISLLGKPFFPFDLSNCYISKDSSPTDDITFWFYTRETQNSPIQLNMQNVQGIIQTEYIKGRPFVLLLHGYTGHKDYSPNNHIRPALFQNDDYNVISVDFNPLVLDGCYFHAVSNLPLVAKCIAHFLDFMIKNQIFTLDDLYVIGHSLGAHTAGMIANYLKSGKLRRIVGLDPAKPMFIFADSQHRLGPDDADYVQIIHTDSLKRGILTECGHQDFYINGGIEQPGCEIAVQQKQYESISSCNHDRAAIYFAESINSVAGFWGFRCKAWTDWALGLCQEFNEHALMGWKSSNDSPGIFIVHTNHEPPYALG